MKRTFDIVCSFIGLVLLWPFFIIIALFIAADSSGPVIFRQARTGRYGRPFVIFKFRTMKTEHDGNSVSVKGESRITWTGEFLRKYKIDELPELWNVLIGNMSFVGPRPDVPGYADRLEGDDRKILELRPGITGPASLKYRNEEELLAKQPEPKKYNDDVLWPDKVRINLDYYHNRNMWLDLKLILRTIF